MKVYRIQCNTYDEDGASHSFLPGIYISREITENLNPKIMNGHGKKSHMK